MPQTSARKIYGVLGYPAKHSLSPAMHNAAFNHLKINAEYQKFEVPPQDFDSFIKTLEEKNICGLNVTVPYKEKIIPFLAKISPEAGLIGAVNTVRVSSAGLEGFNTDGEGFLKHLTEDLKFNPKAKNIAIIGAGGAAKAVCVYLSKSNPKRIAIYDIDKAKLSSLVMRLKENFSGVDYKAADSIEELSVKNCELLINATAVGMNDSDPALLNKESLNKYVLVYDLIYNPPETKLLKISKETGARTSNGLGMLLYQGALSFELWTGKKAPIGVMKQALESEVKKI